MVVEKSVIYLHDGTAFEGMLVYDDQHTAPLPTVMVAHAWAGRSPFELQRARDLAALGYAAFAMDVYGKGVLGTSTEENAALMTPLVSDRPGVLLPRLAAALQACAAEPVVDAQRLAAIGYCFGGLCVLDMARANLDLRGVVSFHGLLSAPPSPAVRDIKARILVLHGHADPMVPMEDVAALGQELTEAGSDWQIHMYGNAMHAFTNPDANDPGFGAVYQAEADRRSWQSLQNFLAEVL